MSSRFRGFRQISSHAIGMIGFPDTPMRIVATSTLLILSFPHPDIGFLALVALVPLLGAVSAAGWRRAFLSGWAAGIVWLFVSYNWISNSLSVYGGISFFAVMAAILILAALHGFYLGIFAAVVPRVSGMSILVRVLVIPSAWVLLEAARTWFPAPFPWLLMGTAFWKTPIVSNLYSVTGVYGVSFWAVAVNVLVWSAPEYCWKRGNKKAIGYLAFLMAVMAIPAVFPAMPSNTGGNGIRVGIVQGNFRQELKWEEAVFEETVSTYLEYTERAVKEGAVLVVWPETAVTSFYQAEPELRDRLRKYSADRNVHLVFGSPGYEIAGREILLYNRVYHLSPGGEEQFYDKVQLVPFGEYVPFSKALPFVAKLVPGDGEFARGKWTGPFSTPVPAGSLVCYEVSFPGLARKEVAGGSKILINVTNDAWFGRTWGPYQHLAISTVRAAENGVPLVRAANTGISAMIDAGGSIVKSIPLDTRDVIVTDLRAGSGLTFYTRWGDWIVTFSAAVIISFVSITLFPWRKRKWTSWTDSKTPSPGQSKG